MIITKKKSDVYIGNKQIENIDLINAIYEYALEKECDKAKDTKPKSGKKNTSKKK